MPKWPGHVGERRGFGQCGAAPVPHQHLAAEHSGDNLKEERTRRPSFTTSAGRAFRRKKRGNIFRVGIFLDFVRPTTRVPHGSHVRRAKRNRIDRRSRVIPPLLFRHRGNTAPACGPTSPRARRTRPTPGTSSAGRRPCGPTSTSRGGRASPRACCPRPRATATFTAGAQQEAGSPGDARPGHRGANGCFFSLRDAKIIKQLRPWLRVSKWGSWAAGSKARDAPEVQRGCRSGRASARARSGVRAVRESPWL